MLIDLYVHHFFTTSQCNTHAILAL